MQPAARFFTTLEAGGNGVGGLLRFRYAPPRDLVSRFGSNAVEDRAFVRGRRRSGVSPPNMVIHKGLAVHVEMCPPCVQRSLQSDDMTVGLFPHDIKGNSA